MIRFVERLAAKTRKGEHRIKTHSHYWAPCDRCGRGMWVDKPGKGCKLTPGCKGKHRRIEIGGSE